MMGWIGFEMRESEPFCATRELWRFCSSDRAKDAKGGQERQGERAGWALTRGGANKLDEPCDICAKYLLYKSCSDARK